MRTAEVVEGEAVVVVEGVAVVVEVSATVAAADTSGDESSSPQAAVIRTRAAPSNVSLEVARIAAGNRPTLLPPSPSARTGRGGASC